MDEMLDPTIEALLEHQGWIRALASRLVHDEHEAEEIVQETWLAALRYRLPDEGSPRRWLAAILRNFARRRHGRDERRRSAEQLVACEGVHPAAEKAIERLGLHRTVVEELDGLEEPLRSTLLLRYFEGLTPARIAELQSVPLKTVYSRIERALAALRAALDRRSGGDRRAWTASFALWLGSGAPWRAGWKTAPRRAGWPMPARIAGAFAGLAASVVLVVALVERSGDVAEVASSSALAFTELDRAREARLDPRAVPQHDARRPEAPPPASDAAPAVLRYPGLVWDTEGRPVPEVSVVVREGLYTTGNGRTVFYSPSLRGETGARPSEYRCTTDGEGRFELAVAPETVGCITVDSRAWVAVASAQLYPWLQVLERRLVVARREPLEGVVRDEHGAPVAEASVVLALPATFGGPPLPEPLDPDDLKILAPEAVLSDIAGRFEVADAHRVPGAELVVAARGMAEQRIALDASTGSFVAVTLRASAAGRLAGRVLFGDGRPCEGAHVGFGDATEVVKSGADGAFAIAPAVLTRGLTRESPRELIAAAPGRLPSSVTPQVDATGELVWPEPLELVLGGPALALHGRVLESDGAPLAAAWVWVADLTFLGRGEFPMSVEGVMNSYGGEYWLRVVADAEGRFSLLDLLDRDYTVRAMDPTTLALGESELLRPGTERMHEVVVPTASVRRGAAGRVLARDGRPLAGARVTATFVALELPRPWSPYSFHLRFSIQPATAGADGSFALPPFAHERTFISVEGDTCETFDFWIGDRDPYRLEILVPERAHVLVEHERADHFELHDPSGLPNELRDPENPSVKTYRGELVAGAREVLVSEDVCVLVLIEDGAVIAELPIEVSASELNVLP